MVEVVAPFGTIYLEDLENRKYAGRIKVYDGNKRYFSSISLRILGIEKRSPPEKIEEQILLALKDVSSVEALIRLLRAKPYLISKQWEDFVPTLSCYPAIDLKTGRLIDEERREFAKEDIPFSFEMNLIGDTYINICHGIHEGEKLLV